MKSLRNLSIATLLSLLLAGLTRLEVHAPSEERIAVPPSPTLAPLQVDTTNTMISGNTPMPVQGSQFVESNTPQPGKADQIPALGSVTALPATQPASCSGGEIGSGTFVWPSDNHSLTGKDYGPAHPGIDIAAGEGSPVYAADAGVVIALGNDEAVYGNVIQIDHHNGYFTVYAHLSVIGVSMCQSVDAGQWIGAAGSTGNARGAHLHFEVAQDGWAIDPWTVLP